MSNHPRSPDHDQDCLRELLKKAREARKVSQRELSAQLGRKHSYVQKLESGEHRIGVVEAIRLLEMLKVDPREFFSEYLDEIAPVQKTD